MLDKVDKKLISHYEFLIERFVNNKHILVEWLRTDEKSTWHIYNGTEGDQFKGYCGKLFTQPPNKEEFEDGKYYSCQLVIEELKGKCPHCLRKFLERNTSFKQAYGSKFLTVEISNHNEAFVKQFIEMYGLEDFTQFLNLAIEYYNPKKIRPFHETADNVIAARETMKK